MTAAKKDRVEATALVFGKIYDYYTGLEWNITLREGVTFTDLAGLMQGLKFLRDDGAEYGIVSRYSDTAPGLAKAEARRERAEATQKVLADRAETRDAGAKKGATSGTIAKKGETTQAERKAMWEQQQATRNSAPKPEQPWDGEEFPSSSAHARQALRGDADKAQAPAPEQNDAKSQDQLIAKIQIAGTKAAPQVQMFSSNTKLEYPVLYAPARVVVAILSKKYGKNKEIEALLSDVGEEYPVNWQVRWEPSPKNPKWKDLQDITKLGEVDD